MPDKHTREALRTGTADAWEEAAERPVEEVGGREGLPFITYPLVPFGIFLLFLLSFYHVQDFMYHKKKSEGPF